MMMMNNQNDVKEGVTVDQTIVSNQAGDTTTDTITGTTTDTNTDDISDTIVGEATDAVVGVAAGVATDVATDVATGEVNALVASTKMTEFTIHIFEIKGKNVVKNYLSRIIPELEKRNIKHEIKLITEEEEEKRIIGGGGGNEELSFPYNLFSSFADKIKETVNKEKKQEENNKEMVDKMFAIKQESLKEPENGEEKGEENGEEKLLDDNNILSEIRDETGVVEIRILLEKEMSNEELEEIFM